MAKNRSSSKSGDLLAWGVTSIFLGIMLLISKLHLFSENVYTLLFDWKNYFLYGGIIFLLCKRNRTIGSILVGIGIILRLQAYFQWQQAYAEYMWPLLFTVVGIVMILFYLRK